MFFLGLVTGLGACYCAFRFANWQMGCECRKRGSHRFIRNTGWFCVDCSHEDFNERQS
jgi:hypothetical protein